MAKRGTQFSVQVVPTHRLSEAALTRLSWQGDLRGRSRGLEGVCAEGRSCRGTPHTSPAASPSSCTLSGAAECKHLRRLLLGGGGGDTPTFSIHVRTDQHVGDFTLLHWDGAVTEWAHRDPNILGECKGTLMCSIGKMIFTEILFTRVTF